MWDWQLLCLNRSRIYCEDVASKNIKHPIGLGYYPFLGSDSDVAYSLFAVVPVLCAFVCVLDLCFVLWFLMAFLVWWSYYWRGGALFW